MENSQKHQKTPSTLSKIIVGIVFVGIPVFMLLSPIISILNDQQNAEKEARQATNLRSCIYDAQTNYSVSQEEIDAAGTDPDSNLILIKRMNNGAKEEVLCYEKYGSSSDESDFARAKSWLSETEAYLESANNAVSTSANNTSPNTTTYCYTTAYGSSAITHCY